MRVSVPIILCILASFFKLSIQKHPKDKALISMKMAKSICYFWKTNPADKLHHQGSNTSIKVVGDKSRFGKGPQWVSCQGVKWSICARAAEQPCSKFRFQDCPTNSKSKVKSWKGNKSFARIVGGSTAKHGELPYQVYLNISNIFRCGGVLLSPHYVITVAHCLNLVSSPSAVKLLFGTISVSNPHKDSQTRTAKKLFKHPDYSNTTKFHDIALIEMDKPVELNKVIKPSVITPFDSYPSGWGLASGWGRTPNTRPNILRKVALFTMSLEMCKTKTNVPIGTDVCMENRNTSICSGDSGGPLVQEYIEDCTMLIGLTRGIVDCGRRGHPSLFIMPQKYRNWIRSVIIPRYPQFNPNPVPIDIPTLVAQRKEFPYQARILVDGITICGGTILNSFYVLTAASCLNSKELSGKLVTVIAGDLTLQSIELEEQQRVVQTYTAHRDYDPVTHAHDIGVIRVKQAFTRTDAVGVAIIPPIDYTHNLPLYTTGWGYMAAPSVFDKLQKIKTRRISFEECFNIYGCLLASLDRKFICGYSDNGGNPCRTDFGGPLAEKIDQDVHVVIGIASFRIDCNDKYPTVYTDVGSYADWLQAQMTVHGSTNVQPNHYPFQVVIKINGSATCTGSLINADHVLSAASCFTKVPSKAVSQQVTVVVGKHNLLIKEDKESTMLVQSIVVHEAYKETPRLHDIALIQLKGEVTLSDAVHPLILRNSIPDFGENDKATSIGWGLAENQSLSALQEISLQILSDFECKTAYGLTFQSITDEMFCTGSLGRGFCVGDSGGPLILPAVSELPCFSLLGILSVAPECQTGTPNTILPVPSIYTEVAYYVPWIRRNLLTTNLKFDSNMAGGTSAGQNEFPFLVKVTYGRVTICAGAILSEFFVLTTAFCVHEKKFGLLSVIAGTGNGIQKRTVGPYRQHEHFDVVTMENDICVMQLVHPFVFNNIVSKIPLLKEFEYNGTFHDSELRQFFGTVDVSGWLLNTPNKMEMAIVPLDTCWKTYGCSIEPLVGKILCANRFQPNFDDSKKPCNLMRGSPLTTALFNGTKILLGLASFGTNCSNINPSMFTQLEHYFTWIQENDLIKGDNNSPPRSFQFQVAIYWTGNFACGGALVSRNHVVSSASCFAGRVVPRLYTISVGKHVLGMREEFEQNRTVEEIYMHEGFANHSLSPNNIALLYFPDPLVITEAVQPALLPLSKFQARGLVDVSGWNSALFKNKMLQNGTIPIMPQSDCITAYNKAREITDTMFCTSTLGSVVCINDPGGPLTQTFDSSCHFLVGIASPDCGEKGKPTVYTDVAKFGHWIHQKVDLAKERLYRANSTLNLKETKNAFKSEFPFIVRILDKNRTTICVGSLMNAFMVITSAFCVYELPPENLKVIAGDHNINAKESTEQERGVNLINIHPDFDKLTQANDIAVLVLTDNFKMGPSVSAIEIISSIENLFDFELFLVGWVRLPSKPTEDSVLQKVQVDAFEGACRTAFGCAMPNYPPSVLCIQIPGTSTDGFGGGYLGAPVVHKFENGTSILYGIASYLYPCSEAICPSVFSGFPYFNGWLYAIFAGGAVAPLNSLPFHVLISIKGKPLCSGALVSDWYVITAAYCVIHPDKTKVEDIIVVLGTRSRVSPYDKGVQMRKLKRYVSHEDYWWVVRDDDIALLELQQPVTFTKSIKPAFIPQPSSPIPKVVFISGYSFNYTFTTLLRETTIHTIDVPECSRYYNHSHYPYVSKALCTTPKAPPMCLCDYGSPMSDLLDSKCPDLIGVASFCNDCEGRRFPSIYTHVPQYWDWILSVTAPPERPLNNTCVF